MLGCYRTKGKILTQVDTCLNKYQEYIVSCYGESSPVEIRRGLYAQMPAQYYPKSKQSFLEKINTALKSAEGVYGVGSCSVHTSTSTGLLHRALFQGVFVMLC